MKYIESLKKNALSIINCLQPAWKNLILEIFWYTA